MSEKNKTSIGKSMNMNSLVVTFPIWSIEDGNYNHYNKGQKDSFAISIEKSKIRKSIKEKCYLKHRNLYEYSFRAKVIGNYIHNTSEGQFLVLDTGIFKFFIHDYNSRLPYNKGEFIVGKGELAVDYFIWGEQSDHISDVPNIYYEFEIEKILYVKTPCKKYSNFKVDISEDSSNTIESGYEIIELNGTDEKILDEEEPLEVVQDENNIETIDGCSIEIIIVRSDTLFVLKKLN